MSTRVPSPVRVVILALAVLALSSADSLAQTVPDRQGFTLLLDVGAGIQHDTAVESTAIGLAGVNLGIGGFVTPDLAIMGRISTTTGTHEVETFFGDVDFTQISGVVGAVVQYWPSDRVNVEVGGGSGLWTTEGDSDTGLGLILGAGFTVFNRGKHNLQIGVEYLPVFTDGAIHNFGITFGYQLL